MNQPLDDFDDDITVPASVTRGSQGAAPLDDFDDDITRPAAQRQQNTPIVQDDFGDDATVPFTPRADTTPTVPMQNAKLPEHPQPQFQAPATPTPPAQLRPPQSQGAWQPPQRPTAPPEPVSQESNTGRIAAAIVAILLLAIVLAALVFFTGSDDADPTDSSASLATVAVSA